MFTNGHQLTAMLPGVGPSAIRQHIVNGVTSDGLTIVAGQQIVPAFIAIAIYDSGTTYGIVRTSIGILRFSQDVACIVIGPHPGLAHRLVVLSDQLSSRKYSINIYTRNTSRQTHER